MMKLAALTFCAILVVAGLVLLIPLYGYALTLDKPIDCTLGADCFIQNYVDLDATASWHDYRCGPLSYDGHKGTDFRLLNLEQMRKGVPVVAAAEGTVLGIRDEMPDISFRDLAPASIKDRECGNGVLLEHAGGYQTQYCHMKKGSIIVAAGDKVTAKQKLGLVGLSGQSEFPHMHLEVRDREGAIIDPFSGPRDKAACALEPDAARISLWNETIRKQMNYIATGVLGYGITDREPSPIAIRDGKHANKTLPSSIPTLVFWVDAFGLQKGDRIEMLLRDPDGSVLVNQITPLESNKAVMLRYIGLHKPREGGWQFGPYSGIYRISRRQKDGSELVILDKDYSFVIDRAPGEPQPAAARPKPKTSTIPPDAESLFNE